MADEEEKERTVYLTIPQAARRYGVHEETLFRAANAGHLVALMSEREPGFARAYLIPTGELEAWIERNRNRLAIGNPRRRKLPPPSEGE